MDEIGTGNDETGTGSDEIGTGNDETNNVSNVQSAENNDMMEKINDDGNKEPPRDQETRENETKISEENPKMTEIVHTRRSERIRKQRYNIHPDDIGNDDDETDQDYIQKDEKQN